MATPTHQPKPTNANLHNAATPQAQAQSQSHLAFNSPAPRSVPSPAAQRTQAGKSPFNASTHAPSSSTMAALNHPTGGSSASMTKALLGSSPAGMFSFDSPNPMTISLSNMGGLESVGMGISMSGISGLGMGLLMTGRGNEQERTKRLEEVINLLKTRPGRISPNGLKLMAQRTGMSSDLNLRRDGTSLCSIAGGSVVVDVTFNARHRVKEVKVEYPTSSQAVKDGEESASKILLDNLSVPPGKSEISLTLDKFAMNLEKLSEMDKLNGPVVEQTFNCFEAISGIYTSLRKLYEHEKKAAMELLKLSDDIDDIAEREVMCKKSGRPVRNVRNEIGMKLDYWMQRRRVRSKHHRRPDLEEDHDMDTESPPDNDKLEGEENIFSLSIECESSVPEMYPPARVSGTWISDQIEKPADELGHSFGPELDWQDPPPTCLKKPEEIDTNNIALSTMDKLPSIRFVAKLHPPVLLPLQVAIGVLGSVGIAQESIVTTDHIGTFDALLLDPDDSGAATVSISSYPVKKQATTGRTVLVADGKGSETYSAHSNSFFVPKPEFARYIREIPFDHPRQLVQLLPILRQYAFLTSLLGDSFSPDKTSPPITSTSLTPLPVDVKLSGSTKLSVIFPRLLQASSTLPSRSPLAPKVEALALEDLLSNYQSSSISITIDVLPNADIAVVDQNLMPTGELDADVPMSSDENATKTKESISGKGVVEKIGNALDVCGDIGIWVEYVRDKLIELGKEL